MPLFLFASTQVTYLPLGLPLWLGGLLTLGLAGVVFLIYRMAGVSERCNWLWLLRFAAIGLAILALMDWTQQRVNVRQPELVVAIDLSESMNLPNRGANYDASETRLQAIKSLLNSQRITELQKKYRLKVYSIGDQARLFDASDDVVDQIQELKAELGKSLLESGLLQIWREQNAADNLAGVLLLSDGVTTDENRIGQMATESSGQNKPVFCIGFGSPVSVPNLRLTRVDHNFRVRVNEPLTVTVSVEYKDWRGKKVRFSAVDKQTNEATFDQQVLLESPTAGSSGSSSNSSSCQAEIQLRIASPGTHAFEIKAEPIEGEVVVSDNVIDMTVQVVDAKPRVLLIQDMPGPAWRFLKETLLRATDLETGSSTLHVNTFLQQASLQLNKTDSTSLIRFPTDDELNQYDLIVLGDARFDPLGRNQGLTEANLVSLSNYVQFNSGNLVVVPGPVHWKQLFQQAPLQELLPMRDLNENVSSEGSVNAVFGDFRIRFETAADRIAWTAGLGSLSEQLISNNGVRWILESQRLNAAALVLARFTAESSSDTAPAITLQKVGNGNVVFHFTDELYRWRYRSIKNLYQQYWLRTVEGFAALRLQSRDRVATLRASASTNSNTSGIQFTTNDEITITADIFDALLVAQASGSREVLVSRDGQTATSLTLTRNEDDATQVSFSGRLANLPVGNYQVVLPLLNDQVLETTFEIVDGSDEIRLIHQDTEWLDQLATSTGGVFYDYASAEKIWAALPELPSTPLGRVVQRSLWGMAWLPFVFALLSIGLLVVEWLMRRKLRLE